MILLAGATSAPGRLVVDALLAANHPVRVLVRCEADATAFAAVAGPSTDQLAGAIGIGGRILVYGMLSGAPCQIDTDTLVFRRLRVDGFTMYAWLEQTSMLGQLRMLTKAQRRLGDDLRSEIRATKLLGEHAEAIALARGSTSNGKVLFVH